MSTEALLTLLGLAIAAYTIVPKDRRLSIAMRLGWSGRIAIVITLVVVHWIKYRDVLASLGVRSSFGPWRWGLNDDTGSYLILAVGTTTASALARFGRLSGTQLPALRDLLSELVLARRFAEMALLVEAHLDRLVVLTDRKVGLPRLRRLIRPSMKWQLSRQADSIEVAEVPDHATRWNELRARVSNRLPEDNRATEAAYELLDLVFDTEGFVRHVARLRPQLAMRIVDRADNVQESVLGAVAKAWLDDPNGSLYREIKNNQALASEIGYVFPNENRILAWLVEDAHRAHDLRVYNAFGQAALSELGRLSSLARDPYCEPLRDYDRDGRWKSPLFATQRVFDLMVSTALRQGERFHMWVMYLGDMVRRMASNLSRISDDADQTTEHPTPYHYLIYDILRMHTDWIDQGSQLGSDRKNVQIDEVDLEFSDTSLLKNIILNFGTCLRHVLSSTHLTQRFKADSLEMALRLRKYLSAEDRVLNAGTLLSRAIVHGGPETGLGRDGLADQIVRSLKGVDSMIRIDLRDEPYLKPLIDRARDPGPGTTT